MVVWGVVVWGVVVWGMVVWGVVVWGMVVWGSMGYYYSCYIVCSLNTYIIIHAI